MNNNLRAKVLLSIQRALLGKIEPSIRGICININDKTLAINAYYDKLPSNEQKEMIEEVATEVLADLPELENCEVHCNFLKVSLRETFPPCVWVYLRKEN